MDDMPHKTLKKTIGWISANDVNFANRKSGDGCLVEFMHEELAKFRKDELKIIILFLNPKFSFSDSQQLMH